jgi:uncharacterized membrane-anchored protein
MYTARVADKSRSESIASTCAFLGAIALLLGFYFFAESVSSLSGISAAIIWSLVAGGFVLSLVGLAMWCRRATKSQRRKLSAILLGVGAVTFCLALLGHVLLTLVAIAIPAFLLGVAVWLVPAVKTTA